MTTRTIVDVGGTPAQRMIMAMLAGPGSGDRWGDPAALADAVDWDLLVGTAHETIKPYLSSMCDQYPFDGLVPSSARAHLASTRRAARLRNLRWAAEIRQIVSTFRARRLALVLVKGAVLQRTVYPDPSTRPMSDVDMLVQRAQMALVHEALIDLGFQARTSMEAHLPGVGLAPDEEAYFLKSAGDATVMVEVHTKLEKHVGYCLPDWATCVDLQGSDGMVVPALEPHAALRHLCFHLAKHGFEHGLLWLLDIRLFVERHGELIDWDELVDRCEPDALPLLVFTLTLASDWFGMPIPERVRRGLDPLKKLDSVPLAWSQMWHLQHAAAPPNIVTVVTSGDPSRLLNYVRQRTTRWSAPVPGSSVNRITLMARRLGSDLKFLRARLRGGGFTLSSVRTANESDRRVQQLRRLLWPRE